jgi:CheY-like chemotaxis protein
MDTDVVSAVAALIGAIAWPLVVLVLVLAFRTQVGSVIRNLSTFSVKAGGVEAALSTQKNVESALTAAAGNRNDSSTANVPAVITGAQATARRAVQILDVHGAPQSRRGLWVDDRPDDNKFERAALEALGLHFDLARTTPEAVGLLDGPPYSIIVSDMKRGDEATAGLELLDELRTRNYPAPCVIYAGSASPQEIAETTRRGGFGETDDPNRLIELVVKALAQGAP